MGKSFNITKLVRPNIRDLVPYSSARDEYSGSASVFLDANENPYNPPLNRYPDPYQKELKKAIARVKGAEVKNLFLGNGSDEGIDLLFRVLCEPGLDNVITVEPTYGMYRVSARINNVEQRSVLLSRDFDLDPAAVIGAVNKRTKMIFLCSPNNPTANSLDRQAILEIIRETDCMVVVDEAYIDFSTRESLLSLIPGMENLVVLQTLSKAWGMAGIRLGMVFAHEELVGYLSRVKYPYNINALSMETALKSMEIHETRATWVKEVLRERVKLEDRLGSFSFVKQVFPSDANFLLVKMEDPARVHAYLMNSGIIVRNRSSEPLCEGCLRITVGTEAENMTLLEALMNYGQTKKPG